MCLKIKRTERSPLEDRCETDLFKTGVSGKVNQEGGLCRKDADLRHTEETGQAWGCGWVVQSKFLCETVSQVHSPF